MRKVLWCVMVSWCLVVVVNVECMMVFEWQEKISKWITSEKPKKKRHISWASLSEVRTFTRQPGERQAMWGKDDIEIDEDNEGARRVAEKVVVEKVKQRRPSIAQGAVIACYPPRQIYAERETWGRFADAPELRERVGVSMVTGGQYGSWMAACLQPKRDERSVNDEAKEVAPVALLDDEGDQGRLKIVIDSDNDQGVSVERQRALGKGSESGDGEGAESEEKEGAYVVGELSDSKPIVCVEQAVLAVIKMIFSLVSHGLLGLWK